MNEEKLEAARQVMIRKEKFEAARQALFALEEHLGPMGTAPRQEIYRLRTALDVTEARLRQNWQRASALLEVCEDCQNTGWADIERGGSVVRCSCEAGRALPDPSNAKSSEMPR